MVSIKPEKERFKSRGDAGRRLAQRLLELKGHPQAVVIALPRGGVPVGYQIARQLELPFDVQVVRKLGVPTQRELAFGAIASGDVAVFNRALVEKLALSDAAISSVIESERLELERRESVYRGDTPGISLQKKTVILVDDGLATGATMRAAIDSVSLQSPANIIVAVPVAAPDVIEAFEKLQGVSCVCLLLPEPLYGVGVWYEDFSQTTDEEVCDLLKEIRSSDDLLE